MDAILAKLRRGERHWPAELAFRAVGLALLCICALGLRWICALVSEPPRHGATPLEMLAALLVFLCLGTGIALTFEGPGLLRHVPLPPRALLP